MAKRKLQRFAEVETFPNVFFHSQTSPIVEDFKLKGKWREHYFNNDRPVVVELGCGKGEYTIGLAARFPDKNFIGCDLKGNRIWLGAKHALDYKLKNVGFVRGRIENIDSVFGENEVDEIWITFPDPQPQKPRERKRLTNLRFLDKYKKLLKPNGVIHLKTDSESFFTYTLQVVKENNFELLCSTNDLYAHPFDFPEYLTTIKTYYERLFSAKGFKICYLSFTLNYAK